MRYDGGMTNAPEPAGDPGRYRRRREGDRALSRCARRCCGIPVLNDRLGAQGVPEAGDAAADRLVQVPRRLQQAVLDPARQARAAASSRSRRAITRRAWRRRRRCSSMQATIVMPADAPALKRERTKAYGAEVVLYDRDREDREAIARDIAEKRGATLVQALRRSLDHRGAGHRGPRDRRGHGRARCRARHRGRAGLRRRADRRGSRPR